MYNYTLEVGIECDDNNSARHIFGTIDDSNEANSRTGLCIEWIMDPIASNPQKYHAHTAMNLAFVRSVVEIMVEDLRLFTRKKISFSLVQQIS